MQDEIKSKAKKKDKGIEDRITTLIKTHLQMPGFIEIPGAGDSLAASLRSSQEQEHKAPYKVIPDYLRHIETEVKQNIRDLKATLVETSMKIRKEAEESRKRIRDEMLGDIETGKVEQKTVVDQLEAELQEFDNHIKQMEQNYVTNEEMAIKNESQHKLERTMMLLSEALQDTKKLGDDRLNKVTFLERKMNKWIKNFELSVQDEGFRSTDFAKKLHEIQTVQAKLKTVCGTLESKIARMKA